MRANSPNYQALHTAVEHLEKRIAAPVVNTSLVLTLYFPHLLRRQRTGHPHGIKRHQKGAVASREAPHTVFSLSRRGTPVMLQATRKRSAITAHGALPSMAH